FSKVRRENLLNGLQIVTVQNPGEPTIRCQIVIRAGSMFDSVGKAGLVALTQRTLLAVNPQIREELESLQTKIEWGIDTDKTWFHLESTPANFEAALEILSRLLVVENIRADAFKRAQTEQLALIKQGQPLPQRADEAFAQALFGDYPYGRNVLGSELTVSNLRQGDVYDVFQRFYLANNASVILSGNIAPEKTLRAFKYLFGGWSKGAPVPATFRQPIQVATTKVVRLNDPQAAEVELRGGVAGVRYVSPEFLLTQLMVEILTTRWKKNETTRDVQVNFETLPRLLPGPFYFSARIAPARLDEVSQRLTESFSGLATTTVSADELSEARRLLLGRLNARPVEDWLRDIEAFSLPRNYPLTIKQRLEAATPADIQSLAKRILEANALTMVMAGRVDSAGK
ncbi:MAG: M16 family metallopeptidase, partial [Acidobacteriota bacterium]